MFNSSRYGRAVGRIAFGATLFAGTAVMVGRLVSMERPDVVMTIAKTWAGAIVLGFVVAALADIKGKHKDPAPLFTTSWTVPAFGIALLAPLTIHSLFGLSFGASLHDLDKWALISLYITVPAHLVFATMTALRAHRIVAGAKPIRSNKIFTWTIITASVPFAVLFFIPPMLVGLTAMFLLPFLERMPGLVERELAPQLPMMVARAR